jgi:hypothetical protein
MERSRGNKGSRGEVHPTLFKLPPDTALGFNTESNEEEEKEVDIEGDILDLIRELPAQINSPDVSSEFKFLVAGAVLWRCADEIKFLRAELEKARSGVRGNRRKSKKVQDLPNHLHRSGILA